MTRRMLAHDVHLARVEAAAVSLYEEQIGNWPDADQEVKNAWRWIAEQALAAADRAAGRTKTRVTS